MKKILAIEFFLPFDYDVIFFIFKPKIFVKKFVF